MALVTEEIATRHGDCPSVAYRISNKGVVVVFSGDMDASALPNLVQLAKNVDLLIFNCAVPDPPELPSQLYDLPIPTGKNWLGPSRQRRKKFVNEPSRIEHGRPARRCTENRSERPLLALLSQRTNCAYL